MLSSSQLFTGFGSEKQPPWACVHVFPWSSFSVLAYLVGHVVTAAYALQQAVGTLVSHAPRVHDNLGAIVAPITDRAGLDSAVRALDTDALVLHFAICYLCMGGGGGGMNILQRQSLLHWESRRWGCE